MQGMLCGGRQGRLRASVASSRECWRCGTGLERRLHSHGAEFWAGAGLAGTGRSVGTTSFRDCLLHAAAAAASHRKVLVTVPGERKTWDLTRPADCSRGRGRPFTWPNHKGLF